MINLINVVLIALFSTKVKTDENKLVNLGLKK